MGRSDRSGPYETAGARKNYWRGTNSVDAQYWDEMIDCAFAVHFFSYETRSYEVLGNPKRELYSYLAPKFCPASFYPHEQF